MIGIQSTDIFISYREQGEKSSRFLNVTDVLRSKDINKINSVYQNFLFSINSFEASVDKFEQLEKLLYNRLIFLIEEKDKEHSAINKIKAIFAFLGIEFTSKKNKIQSVHNLFDHHISAIKYSLLEKEKSPIHPELEELKSVRLNDIDQELKRLNNIKRVKESLKKVEKTLLTPSQKVAFAHTIELREKIKNDYYVINHGQNIEMLVVNIVAKKLKQIFEPTQYENFEILRHDIFLQHIKDQIQNVDWYRQHLIRRIDHHYRELICGDCFLESTSIGESAIDYFAGRTNIAISQNDAFIQNILDRILCNYFPDPKTREELRNEIIKLINNLGYGGTLYSICIPKQQFPAVGYFSRPYGHPVADNKYNMTHLELMQDGLHPSQCQGMPYEQVGIFQTAPQVRLLSHKLDAKKGVLILPYSTLSDQKIDSIEKNIELLIQQAQIQFRLK